MVWSVPEVPGTTVNEHTRVAFAHRDDEFLNVYDKLPYLLLIDTYGEMAQRTPQTYGLQNWKRRLPDHDEGLMRGASVGSRVRGHLDPRA